MASIDEGRESPADTSEPFATAQPARHRLISQTVVGAFRRPSLSVKAKRETIAGAADSRMNFTPSNPSEEEVRRFYALYGQRMEPNGRTASGLADASDHPKAAS